MRHAIIRNAVVTGLDNKPYIQWQAYSEGYGIIASSPHREFVERAALNFNSEHGLDDNQEDIDREIAQHEQAIFDSPDGN